MTLMPPTSLSTLTATIVLGNDEVGAEEAAASWGDVTAPASELELIVVVEAETELETPCPTSLVVVVVDLALPSLGVEQKVVDFRAFADHQK